MKERRYSNLFFSLDTIVKDFKNGRSTLGRGGSGKVDLIRHISLPGELFAMKSIPLRNGIRLEEVQNEIQLHSSLQHPNIIKIYGSQVHEGVVYLFLEYARHGDLFNFIQTKKNSSKSLSMKKSLRLFCECVSVVDYMHSKGILHRDIKPENILLDEDLSVRLCDFDWAIKLSEFSRRKTLCGTVEYMAPEVYNGDSQTTKTDVWALGESAGLTTGILLYELFEHKPPFQTQLIGGLKKLIENRRISFHQIRDERLQRLILKILRLSPIDRPSCKEILLDKDLRSLLAEADLSAARRANIGKN